MRTAGTPEPLSLATTVCQSSLTGSRIELSAVSGGVMRSPDGHRLLQELTAFSASTLCGANRIFAAPSSLPPASCCVAESQTT